MSQRSAQRAADYRDRLLRQLREDRTSGASQLARQALEGLMHYTQVHPANNANALQQDLLSLARALRELRPSMAPIANLLDRWLEKFQRYPATSVLSVASNAERIAQRLHRESQQAIGAIGRYMAELIRPDSTVMTHSFSSTVRAGFEQLAAHRVRAIVTESRPGLEGRALALHLAALDIPTDFITDAQMGLFVHQADAVVVGADGVLSDGSVVNKSGTYLLALAARAAGKPFYVCTESFKLSAVTPEQVALERRSIQELDAPQAAAITAHNIYFDITPAKLISGYLCEDGLRDRLRGG